MSRLSTLSILACALALLCTPARAVTLDWAAASWTAGTLNNSFDVDATTSGNDVTIAISGNTAQFGNATPAINTALQGGFGTAPSALNLFVDLTSQAQGITVAVSFSAAYTLGVENVSFSLFDVDGVNQAPTSFQDQVRSIIGIAPDGSQVAATVTAGGPANSVTGTGVSAVVNGIANSNNTGAGSGDGNVNISFAGPIKSFSFVYGSGTNTQADPTQQQISMSNLDFTPVPEVNPTWAAAFSCLAAAYLIRRHNARVGK